MREGDRALSDVTVHAKSLLRFFKALSVTTSRPSDEDGFSDVYLRTGKAVADGGVSPTQVLTGISTDGVVVGRMLVSCNGDLPAPVGVSATTLPWLTAVLKEVAADDKEALVTLRVNPSTLDSALVPETLPHREHKFVLRAVDDFPVETCENALDGSTARAEVTTKDGDVLPVGNVTQWPSKYLKLLAQMSQQLDGEDVRIYRVKHPASTHVVTIGPWRGALPANPYPLDIDVDEPDDQEAL